MDTVATGLDGRSPEERASWFPMSKKLCERKGIEFTGWREASDRFPVTLHPYGAVSINGEIIERILEMLSDVLPYSRDHRIEVSTAVLAGVGSWGLRDAIVCSGGCVWKGPESPLPIPVGIAVGAYAAIMDVSPDFIGQLASDIVEAAGGRVAEARTAAAIAMLQAFLIESGYYSTRDPLELSDRGLISYELEVVLGDFDEHACDPEYWETMGARFWPELSHSERVLAECLWFMARVATQFKDDNVGYSTVPREQVPEVMASTHDFAALSSLYGGFCTASEQGGDSGLYPMLTPRELVTTGVKAEKVTELVGSLN